MDNSDVVRHWEGFYQKEMKYLFICIDIQFPSQCSSVLSPDLYSAVYSAVQCTVQPVLPVVYSTVSTVPWSSKLKH